MGRYLRVLFVFSFNWISIHSSFCAEHKTYCGRNFKLLKSYCLWVFIVIINLYPSIRPISYLRRVFRCHICPIDVMILPIQVPEGIHRTCIYGGRNSTISIYIKLSACTLCIVLNNNTMCARSLYCTVKLFSLPSTAVIVSFASYQIQDY